MDKYTAAESMDLLLNPPSNEHIALVYENKEDLDSAVSKYINEGLMVEQWWQEKPFEGSYVCPFPKQFFNAFPHSMHSERAVVAAHDIVVNASDESNSLDQSRD